MIKVFVLAFIVQITIGALFKSENLHFTRDLKKVFDCEQCIDKPEFLKLPWCLLEGNGEIMYAQCDGVDYTMLFDSNSFILNKQFNKPSGGT